MASFVLLIIFTETLDHRRFANNGNFELEAIAHIGIFAVAVPILMTILAIWLERKTTEQTRAVEDLRYRKLFSEQLSRAASWDQLTQLIVQFPRTLIPVVGSSLLIFRSGNNQLDLAAEWRADGKPPPNPLTTDPSDSCLFCPLSGLSKSAKSVSCDYTIDGETITHCHRYCLPLSVGGCRVALLHLDLPMGEQIEPRFVDVLNAVAPEMALALDRSMIQNAASQQSIVSEAERQRVARELHDTLGQNIAYLRLKLDQLSGWNMVAELEQVQHELERMRNIANEAYQQVRGTLDDLRISPIADLESLLNEHIETFEDYTQIQVQFFSKGRSRMLPLRTKRQCLYICKEALNNINKHSQAKTARVELDWQDCELKMTISDDGLGFDLRSMPLEGHYGLAIMQERAETIKAILTVESSVNGGTQVRLTIPAYDNENGQLVDCTPVSIPNKFIVSKS